MNSSTISFSSTANTAVFFLFGYDASTDGSTLTATFAGQTMTTVGSNKHTIGYIGGDALNGNTSGDISLTGVNATGFEIAYWGVAENIDVDNIKTATGSTLSGDSSSGTQTNATLSALNVGDVVYSIFDINDFANAFYTGTGLVSFDGTSNEHDAIVTTDTIGTAGDFNAATAVADGTLTSGFFGSSIAFTAVPEASAAVLLGLSSLMLFLRRRPS